MNANTRTQAELAAEALSEEGWDMAKKRTPSTKMKLEALKQGRELSVDPFALAHAEPGTYPGTDEKAVLTLAREYQRAEDSDYVYISWNNQVKAANYFNTHGLVNTLDEIVRIGGSGALS